MLALGLGVGVSLSAQNCGNFSLNLSADTTVCESGAAVTLAASASQEPFEWSWSPASGLSAADQPTVSAQPNLTTTYTVRARAVADNLIFNGSFALGPVGFTTDYSPASGGPNGPLHNEGEYLVFDNPNQTHEDFLPCGDHTTGDGNMMVVNSSGNQDQVWCQVVSVTPNTDYAFAAWVASVFPDNPANLQFSFDGTLLGAEFNASSNTCEWQQFAQTWNSGASTDVEICITNVNEESSGNDFAIDDIEFGPICEAEDSTTVTVTPPLPNVAPDCSSSTGSITLSWPSLPNATGYEVEVLDAPAGNFIADTAYLVEGLMPDQAVSFEIHALNGPCPGSTVEADCSTQPCPDYTLELTGESVICEGEAAALELLIDTESPGPFTLTYSVGGLPATVENLAPGPNPLELSLPAGTSEIALTALTDASAENCPIGDLPGPLTVTVEAPPEAGTAEAYAVCEGTDELLQLEELLAGNDPGGEWVLVAGNAGSAFDAANATLAVAQLPAGGYGLHYRLISEACPSDTALLELQVEERPQADAGADVELDCTLEEALLGQPDPGFGWRYAWESLSGGTLEPADGPQLMVSEAGLYVLEVVDPLNSCIARDTVEVRSLKSEPQPQLSVVGNECGSEAAGQISVDSVEGGNAPFVYSLDGESFTTQSEFTQLPAGSYEVYVQDLGGCIGVASATLEEASSFSISLEASPDRPVRQGERVLLRVETEGVPEGQLQEVRWQPAPDSCRDCLSIEVRPLRTQLYTVRLIDNRGCEAAASINIPVKQERAVYAPTAFSPNDDGVNDVFFLFAGPEFQQGNRLYIADRWGNLLFEAEDFPLGKAAAGWDGFFRGTLMPPGVYTFSAELETVDGQPYTLSGALHLIR